MSQRRVAVAIVLAVVGAALSALLLLQHHGESLGVSAVESVCGEGASSGCETVARSAYSTVGGVPLAALGLAFYLSLAGLAFLGSLASGDTRSVAVRLCSYGVVLALAADIVLLGVQIVAIKAFCRVCIATYVVNAGLLVTLWPVVRARTPALSALLAGDGRVALGGWLLGTAALAAAILSFDATLSYREARRNAGMLGALPAAPGDTLQQAQAEVRRLQQTLDDPQKREQYLTEKAVKEFETATPQSLDVSQAPFSGPADAPIQVVEYSDYLCPFCRGLFAAFKDYLPKSAGRVSIHYKNYPLDKNCNPRLSNTVHEGACWLALGAICAQQLGPFAAFQEKANTTPEKAMTRDDAIRLGSDVGIAAGAMGSCLDAPATKARLSAEIDEAARVGVRATPTLFLNGKMLPRVNDFLLAVNKESARLGLAPMPVSQ